MASKPPVRALLTATALGLLLAACSGGSGSGGSGLPDPPAGKAAAFDVADISSSYDVGRAVDGGTNSFVAPDRAGNVFMVNGAGGALDILRMTPKGAVSRFAKVSHPSVTTGMAATPDGGVLIGGAGGLTRVDGHGSAAPVGSDHHFASPNPIGSRSDGSVVIVDSGSVWSLKGGHASSLYGKPGASGGGRGVVDASGTAYIGLTDGAAFADMVVLPPGGAPSSRLRLTGTVPGGGAPISALRPITLTADSGGGFYAMATDAAAGTAYVVHVRGTTGTVLARSAVSAAAAGCRAGKQYDALDNPCTMPWFAVQSGDRVLVMGSSHQLAGDPVPGLAIRPDATT